MHSTAVLTSDVPGEHDHFDAGMVVLDEFQDLDAVHFRHPDVQKDDVVELCLDGVDRGNAIGGGIHRITRRSDQR